MTQTDARATPSMYGRLYYGLRLLLHKRRGLLRLSQVLRAYVMLGLSTPSFSATINDAVATRPFSSTLARCFLTSGWRMPSTVSKRSAIHTLAVFPRRDFRI
jgi:hypothetical protein